MAELRLAELDIESLLELGSGEVRFQLGEAQWHTARRAYETVMELIGSGDEAYGVHTHYGHNVTTRVDWRDYRGHQRRLHQYLHVGVGPALAASTVRRALRLQCLKVAEGRSGVHPTFLEEIIDLSNGPCSHVVPSWGSLGASGDLIPMAHAIAPAVERAGVHGPRDVIGMVNTNATMASLAVENFVEVGKLLETAHEITALVSVALLAPREHFGAELFSGTNARQENALRSAEKILSYRDAFLTREAADGVLPASSPVLQERYSVRCAPMILGNNADLLEFGERKILMDALSVADNPVLSEGDEGPRFHHGGLFYAASLATAADVLQDSLLKTGEMLDRQVLLLMDSAWSHGLPDNLALEGGGAGAGDKHAGASGTAQAGGAAGGSANGAGADDAGADHLKGIHQLVSALLQKLKASATRSHELSFSSEQHNQDVLPAAMTAQLQLQSSISVARELTRGALFCAKRAGLLRVGRAVPHHLSLAAWGAFGIDETSGRQNG